MSIECYAQWGKSQILLFVICFCEELCLIMNYFVKYTMWKMNP